MGRATRSGFSPAGHRRWLIAGLLCALAIALLGPVAHAQAVQADRRRAAMGADAATGALAQDTTEQVAPDSPRASLTRYLRLARGGQDKAAALYLDLPESLAGQGPVLARRLKAVLDRHIWFDLERISPRPDGDTSDGLRPLTDQIATIPALPGAGERGAGEPVRMVRHEGPGGASWVFSRSTVGRINAWYERLEDRWLLEHLPEPLLRTGPRQLLWWQWLALPALFLLAWGAGLVLSWTVRAVLGRLAARTATRWDDAILERVAGPLTLASALVAAYLLLPWLRLYEPAEAFLHQVLRTGLFVVFFWALLRAVDVTRQVVALSPWAQDRPASRSLAHLGARVVKVVVIAMAVIAVLSQLGYPVASLVAGLGIGGLALALAGQKTVENLFGAFSIGVDQPFREGDFVRIEDFVGTVEAIGLRSTRIRTLDRTLISIPNGRLAEMRLESFTARDRIRLACTIGLVYGTTAAQMREVLAGLERVLREHPKIWPDAVVVRFKEFADSSLNIEIMAWFMTSDFGEFQLIRQDVLLRFMEVVEQAGSSFAFPTRTVHLVSEKG